MRPVAWLVALAFAALLGLTAWCWSEAQRYDLSGLERRAPRRTAMMLQREREAREHGLRFTVDQRTIPYAAISPTLRRAVLVAEDDAFFSHDGLDWNEIRASARRNWEERRLARGGSTVTQQLARNLFLGNARTPARKLTEVFLALRLERVLTKRRIFELYLNLIEWGDGIYGAEAAAWRYFGVPASGLDPRQAVLLAAVIINPRRFSVLEPTKRIERRVRLIASRLRRRGLLGDEEYRIAIGEPPAPVVPADTLESAPVPVPAAPVLPESISVPADSGAAPPP